PVIALVNHKDCRLNTFFMSKYCLCSRYPTKADIFSCISRVDVEDPGIVSLHHPVPYPEVVSRKADEIGLTTQGLLHEGHNRHVIAISFQTMAWNLFESPHVSEVN